MSYTIGDGVVALALAGDIVGYLLCEAPESSEEDREGAGHKLERDSPFDGGGKPDSVAVYGRMIIGGQNINLRKVCNIEQAGLTDCFYDVAC